MIPNVTLSSNFRVTLAHFISKLEDGKMSSLKSHVSMLVCSTGKDGLIVPLDHGPGTLGAGLFLDFKSLNWPRKTLTNHSLMAGCGVGQSHSGAL
jgi:hypothetical protein